MGLKSTVKAVARRLRLGLLNEFRSLASDSNLTTGQMAAWRVRSMEAIASLQDVEFSVSSQWGQDGIVDWLIERAGIPAALHSFVEFGVESYRVSNTRFLLQTRNWRGLIMDSGSDTLPTVKADGLYWKHDLTVKQAFITRENINDLMISAGFSGEIGLLNIDVDGNDYWVWEAVTAVNPVICICEYNAVFGDLHPVSIPYNPRFDRVQAHFSHLYFGASIAALRSLAARKGYHFVGTNLAANDAFFVREDYAQRFVDRSLRAIQALPSRFRESRDQAGQLNYIGGLDRLQAIASMPVVNIETGQQTSLGDLSPVYSDAWLSIMTGRPVQPQPVQPQPVQPQPEQP
jgi:hypothetical protein